MQFHVQTCPLIGRQMHTYVFIKLYYCMCVFCSVFLWIRSQPQLIKGEIGYALIRFCVCLFLENGVRKHNICNPYRPLNNRHPTAVASAVSL